MENKFKITKENVKVIDGSVIISSEELARAIQNEEIKIAGEEQNEHGCFCFIAK